MSVREIISVPTLMLASLGMTLASLLWHELGHATACSYGGARPGRVGVGVYLIWPALYTDLTDSYRLSRADRLRTDLGQSASPPGPRDPGPAARPGDGR